MSSSAAETRNAKAKLAAERTLAAASSVERKKLQFIAADDYIFFNKLLQLAYCSARFLQSQTTDLLQLTEL